MILSPRHALCLVQSMAIVLTAVVTSKADEVAYVSPAIGETFRSDFASVPQIMDDPCLTPITCNEGSASECTCPACQEKKKAAPKPNPCAASHKILFYDNDFSYLDNPDYHGDCFGDCLKHMPVDNCGRWGQMDIGGQARLRYHHEVGMGQVAGETRFQDTDNDLLLTRARLYSNWQMTKEIRFYTEGIYADVQANQAYIPRPIDNNFGDFLNLFFDVQLTDEATVRIGRQELLYGSQRLVSPLDWANTRRTFEGVKVMTKEGDWAIDGFWTHHVPVLPNELDRVDYQQRFYGAYGIYSGMESAKVDLYYFGYDDTRPLGTNPPGSSDFSIHTLGMRLYGEAGDWLYEVEGGPQFGRQSGLGVDQSAGFATIGLGRNLDLTWSPTIWVYYDYASGNTPGGDFNRFNQLFPLGHKYLGFIDATARANIESPNVLLTMKPHEKWNLLFWYYQFQSNTAYDIVPSLGGTPAQSTTSKDWGNELDILATYNINARTNILFGYSHFWVGNKITPPGGAFDADFFYTQWELNF